MQTETPSSEHMIRVGLATPPGALRAGVRALLANAARIVIAAEVSSLDEFNGLPVDIDVIVATSGAVRRSAAETIVHAPLLVLAADDGLNWHKLERISPRVWGILPLEADASALQAAVQALYEGLIVASPSMLKERLANTPPDSLDTELSETLTPREAEVLQQLALGLTNKGIALALGISEHTVKYHISAIYGKLGVMNRAEAVHSGVRRGLIEI